MNVINKNNFNQKIFSRIENLINKYHLINNGDIIAVALSGGKDSVLTLHALSNFQKNSDIDFELIAISVDEGIVGYRSQGIDAAIINSKKCGVDLIQKSFKDSFNFNLDDIFHEFKSACIPCGVFRRNILNKTAYELGANKIATGHNLDDEIQSFLMSFARGDTLKFSKFGPELNQINQKLIPRIKPLWDTPEKEVGIWVIMNEISVHLDECPYSSLSLRAKIKNFLNSIESNNQDTKIKIMDSFKKTLKVNLDNPMLYECKRCGEPTSAEICKACELIELINNRN